MRCKFKLDSIELSIGYGVTGKTADGKEIYGPREQHTLKMTPVFSSDPDTENKKFWDASPGGEFKLNVVNAAAVQGLVLGAEYYIDVTPATPA